jgi:hypothetical protein
MRERRMSLLLMLIAGGVLILTLGCAGTGLAVRAGLAPALDLQIPTGAYRMLLIHNGPSFYCAPYGLHDNCRRRVRYEFYVHYITPTTDRVLIWVPTMKP